MYIRMRLTLWFLFILTLLLAVFSIAIYQFTNNHLLTWVNQDVHNQAALLQGHIHLCPGTTRLCVPHIDVFRTPDVYLQVRSPEGTVLASSSNLEQHILPILSGTPATGQVKEVLVDKLLLFVYCQPLMINNRLQGYVIAAHAPQTIYYALGQLKNILIPEGIEAFVLVGIIVWLLVWRAMRPLESLAVTAAEIANTKDHSRRLSSRKRNDEINRLVHTINGMLQALEEAYQEVQKVNDLQSHFLVDVSHELRTPLTIMLSSLDLIKKVGATDPEFRTSSLESIRVEAERMARMVTQLLILARSDANVTAAYEPILVRDVLADLCSQRHTNANEPSLACYDLELLEGALVWGNLDYLKQLFLILLDNAFKYTAAGGKVEIYGSLNEGMVTIMIVDTGIGIPPDDLPRIFERFHRAENAHFRSGAGLGLAIARRITEQHKGNIEVKSELGSGSRFIVTLPSL
ncbi:MAG: HAMP domain-containing histidine kinase [Ktedonobacteraceae bacterium]|nr:HAMP domain-containing histidine kinase [Ktedonobacteraceae bacterium]